MRHAPARLREDLGAGRVVVRVAVGHVVVLVRVEVPIRISLVDASDLANRAVGPLERVGEDHFGAVHAQDALALGRDVLRDAEAHAVTARRANHGVGNPGVSGRGVEDGATRLQETGALALEHHAEGGPILHRAARVLPFGLRVQLDPLRHLPLQAPEAQQWRVADQVENRVRRGRRSGAHPGLHKKDEVPIVRCGGRRSDVARPEVLSGVRPRQRAGQRVPLKIGPPFRGSRFWRLRYPASPAGRKVSGRSTSSVDRGRDPVNNPAHATDPDHHRRRGREL